MKKRWLVLLTILMLMAIGLGACSQSGASEEVLAEQMAETMIAIAFTQTAMAEPPPAAIEPTQPQPTEALPTESPQEEAPLDEETIAPTEIVHQITPGNPGWIQKWFYDTNASLTASGGYVNSGDDYIANLYERPFTEGEMVYRPDVDINKTEISEDNTFYYVTIYPNGTHPEGGLQAAYGVEIDEDLDGRGDLLVIADRPSSAQWDIAGLSVWRDSNNDVGGQSILRPNDNYQGDSYDQELFSITMLTDPDAAWARVSQGSPVSVTIAFKKSLVNRSTFVWGVWAADALLDPSLFDHHDHFTQAEAGSPYASHSTYPLKALNLIDNTCRETYKFEATEPIRGLCHTPEPPPPTPTPTPIPTAVPLGSISGLAFDDLNNNGVRDAGEPLTIYSSDVTFRLHLGSCSNPQIASSTSNPFTFANLLPGVYCVRIT
ncbi:MAG: hypothetical protein ACNA70_01170, partial [Brevefilum sp.]